MVVVARGIFDLHCSMWVLFFSVVVCRIFSYDMQTLSCGLWDLVTRPRMEARPLAVLATVTTRDVPPLCYF